MNVDYDAELRRIARTLSEIAHTLESADGADERVQRTLVLTRDLVPYRRFALLRAFPGTPYALFVVPELSEAERSDLLSPLIRVLRLVANAEEIGRSSESPPHLTLPLMGLDEVIGLVRMEPQGDSPYDVQHLRLLSVVAAQLGAYLTMIRLREEDARRTKELAAAHDFQQLLVGVVSHDLRNPLSVITAMASSLLRKTDDPQKATAIERVLRSAERANRIINDLLDVTHARVSGDLPVTRKRLDLHKLLKEVIEDLAISNPGRELQFESSVREAVLGEWDPDRLTQVVTNLVSNALHYGEKRAPVLVDLHVEEDEIVLRVHNRGPVIPGDLLPVLFNPFTQGRHTQRRVAGGGLGLGLYIVDQIVRSHGGMVSARSTASEGTTFTVILPRSMSAHEGAGSSREEPRGGAKHLPAERGAADPTTVLVVDDDFEVRVGISEILQSRGYKIVTASHGAEALELLHKGLRPSLILLDLRMPVMDGESFCAACREHPELAPIPRIIISADAATAVKLTRGGASGFLAKPLQPETLLTALERFSD